MAKTKKTKKNYIGRTFCMPSRGHERSVSLDIQRPATPGKPVPGRPGTPGKNGKNGKNGPPGRNGKDGKTIIIEKEGRDGKDGEPGPANYVYFAQAKTVEISDTTDLFLSNPVAMKFEAHKLTAGKFLEFFAVGTGFASGGDLAFWIRTTNDDENAIHDSGRISSFGPLAACWFLRGTMIIESSQNARVCLFLQTDSALGTMVDTHFTIETTSAMRVSLLSSLLRKGDDSANHANCVMCTVQASV